MRMWFSCHFAQQCREIPQEQNSAKVGMTIERIPSAARWGTAQVGARYIVPLRICLTAVGSSSPAIDPQAN